MPELPAFILHLERATNRAKHVSEMIAALPGGAEAFPAVDSRTMPADERARYDPEIGLRPRYPFALSDTEIAVFLSYRAIWARIASGAADAALVLEDDLGLDKELFPRALRLASEHATPERLIRLPEKPREKPGQVLAEGEGCRLIRPAIVGLGMQAQVVGRAAAIALLAATERFDRPVDTTLQMTWHTGVDTLAAMPAGISDVSGTMGGSTLSKRSRSLGARLGAEFARARYRIALARTARARSDQLPQHGP